MFTSYKEKTTINGKEYLYTKSDKYHIRKVGTEEVYSEAVDAVDKYEYEETDIPLEEEEEVEDVNV